MQVILIAIIRFYQKTLSLIVGRSCRFYPTCSSYAIQAIQTHGSLKGSWLTIKRISRCHPLNPGGIDPVPASPNRDDLDKGSVTACKKHHINKHCH